MEESKVRSQDTPLGKKDGLQWRKESLGVRIHPWGERIGCLQWRKEMSEVRILPWGERGAIFTGGKNSQGSGYDPGEKGGAAVS